MNFSTHIAKQAKYIQETLECPKPEIIRRFPAILHEAGSLIMTDRFLYWLDQINDVPIDEIPTTHFGLRLAINYATGLPQSDRNNFTAGIDAICECLFCYCDEDECDASFDLFFYTHLESGLTYKISPITCIPELNNIDMREFRFAYRSELDADPAKFL